jgi:hypothetical protein
VYPFLYKYCVILLCGGSGASYLKIGIKITIWTSGLLLSQINHRKAYKLGFSWGFMDRDAVVKLILKKGVKNVNLSMFSDLEKKSLLQEVVEIFLRQGKTSDAISLLEHVDAKRFADMLRPVAEQCVELGDYKKAALIYDRIGYNELSEFIHENFVK